MCMNACLRLLHCPPPRWEGGPQPLPLLWGSDIIGVVVIKVLIRILKDSC